MLKIVKAGEPIPVNQIVIVIYSPPGLGKTSLGYTADEPLLLDSDKGSYRASGRKDTVAAPTWSAIETMTPDELAPYKTIILDTAGRTLDLLSTDIIAKDPKCSQGGGSLSLKGFGILKSRFAAYLNMLKARGKDIVLICHMDEQRNGDDVIERLDVQGGSKGEIYKSADAMGRIIIKNGERFIDFNPRENSFGKNPCGLPILPFALGNKTCLQDIIRIIKERLNGEIKSENKTQTKSAQEAPRRAQVQPAPVTTKEPPFVALMPREGAKLAILGTGLDALRSGMTPDDKAFFGIKMHGGEFCFEEKLLFNFQDLCKRLGVVWTIAPETKPNGGLPKAVIPQKDWDFGEQPSPAKSTDPILFEAKAVEPKGKKPFMKLKWSGAEHSCFDKGLWPILLATIGKPVMLETKAKGQWSNLVRIVRVDGIEFGGMQ